MSKIRRLVRHHVKKIMWHFCVDVAAVAAARLLGINRNTINRYYGLFRQAIYAQQSRQLQQLTGKIEVGESYFGASRVRGGDPDPASTAVAPLSNPCLASMSAMDTCIPRSYAMIQRPFYKLLFAAKWRLKVLFTPMAGRGMMAWSMSALTSTSAPTTIPHLPTVRVFTSMASRASGCSRNAVLPSSMALGLTSAFTLRSPNGDGVVIPSNSSLNPLSSPKISIRC